ncbi:uncharacterized protein LOC112573005 isoform X1 [Pomacea canaliculata]|uniref:uncharacterized protein LOC112573005 isoform X1 n=1 Tax=Pomacea canaliculata TaxID=400727 RepID=UPI000D72C084|nr:uncharacterized protein LOC112573005 isoform X1 [Pomacea canaliculata]
MPNRVKVAGVAAIAGFVMAVIFLNSSFFLSANTYYINSQSPPGAADRSAADVEGKSRISDERKSLSAESAKDSRGKPTWSDEDVLLSRGEKEWQKLTCGPSKLFRPISLSTDIGNLTFYGFLSAKYDQTVTARALKGWMFEKKEIESFLTLSRDLPLIDVGANVGLVALQAALQKRTVVAIEPIAANALRLCRSVLDFGHAGLVHVIQNAVSSREGHVTLATQAANTSTLFTVNEAGRQFTHDLTLAYAIKLDRILEMLPFRRAALKIDVESHEGHVLAGSRDLFKTVDVPLVWMEWQHVKGRATFGGQFVVDFMTARNFRPHHVISGKLLEGDFMSWPFTVLWKRDERAAV